MKTPRILLATLLTFLLSLAPPAAALPHTGNTITGTIQKVDARKQEVQLLREDKGTLLKFIWNKDTTFAVGTRAADSAILKKGTRVVVDCHIPFFGPPVGAKVTLLPAIRPGAAPK